MTNAAASQGSGSIPVAGSLGRFVWADPVTLLAVVIASLVLFDSPSFLGIVQADSLQLAFATWDLSTHEYAWEGLRFSRVPSLVPDLVLFGGTQLLTGSWRFAFLVFGTMTLLGLALAAGWIIDSLTRCGWRTGTRVFLLLALLVLFLELPLTAASRHTELFVPNDHSGPLVFALGALCVARACMERPSIGKSLLLFVMATLGILSDPLFAIAFTGPVLVITGYRFLRGRLAWKPAALVVAPAVAGVGVGRLLDLFLKREAVPAIVWEKVPEHAWAFIRSPAELAAAAPITVLIAFALPIALFLCYPLTRRLPGHRPEISDALQFWWSIAATTLLAVVATTALVYDGIPLYRYTMPLQWWPIVFAAAFLVRALGRRAPTAISLAVGGLTATLAVFYSLPGVHAPAILSVHHPLEACLAEAHRAGTLKAGLGDYWTSRYVAASSDWRLQIDQLWPEGEAEYFDNDRFAFTHDIDDGTRLPEYNFIVMNGLNERMIRARYGAPDRILDCGGGAIWIYDDATALRQALIGSAPALYAMFLTAGRGIDRICIPADRVQSALHGPAPDRLLPLEGPLQVRADSPDDRQPRTWGPTFSLPAERWVIALDYGLASDAPGRDRWEISAGWGRTTLYEAPLTPTDHTGRGTVRAELDLKMPVRGVEIRSFLAGTGTLAIHGAELARAGAAPSGGCAR